MNVSLRSLIEGAKLIGAATAGMIAMGSVYSGFVALVGGRLVPWLTPSETSSIVDTSFKALRMDFDAKLSVLIEDHDRRECSDYKDRLVRARMALQRNSRDMVASDLQFASLQKIATIPNCRLAQ